MGHIFSSTEDLPPVPEDFKVSDIERRAYLYAQTRIAVYAFLHSDKYNNRLPTMSEFAEAMAKTR